jgi:O-antigen/teichoic acid export membrane protein
MATDPGFIKAAAFRHVSQLTAARYVSEGLFAVRGFVLAHLLGPLTFGLWTEMRLSLTFLQFIRLGTNEAFMRDYPYHLGAGTTEFAEKIKQVVSGFNLAAGAAVVLSGWAYLGVRHYSEPLPDLPSWALWLFVFFLSQIYWLVQSQLQAAKRFLETSKLLAGFSMLSTAGGLLAAFYCGLLGFLGMLAVSYGLIIALVLGFSIRHLKSSWDLPLIGRLIQSGFPIMAANALFILLLNMDKILIWLFMQSRDLGIYAIQSYLTNFIILAPGSVAMVLFPSVMERLGETKRPESISGFLTKPTLLLAHLACPALGVMYFGLHLPIRWLAPEYVSAILPGQILILASFFVVVARMPAAILVSLRKQNWLMSASLLSVALSGWAGYLAIQAGKGLAGVAGCSALGFFFYSGLITLMACRQIKLPFKSIMNFLLGTAVPPLAALLSLALLERLIPSNPADWLSDSVQTVFKCLLFLIPTGAVLLVYRARNSGGDWRSR